MRKSIITPVLQTDPLVYDLTTVEALETELGLESNTDADAVLQNQITQASRMIADLCDRVFALQSVTQDTRLHWNDHAHSLPLVRYPVVSIESFTVNDGVTVDATSYDVDYETGLIYRKRGNWHGHFVIEYTAGYDLPDEAPPMLARACMELVKTQRLNAKRDPAVRDVQHGDTRVTYWVGTRGGVNDAIPPAVTDLINEYKRLGA